MINRRATINRFGSANEISIDQETHLPELKPHEVLIKIEASTVSATDIFIRKGIYPLLKEKPRLTLGYDFVGRIEKTGSNVKDWKKGQLVGDICMIGGNADYIIRNEDTLLKVSEEISAEQAACLIMTGMTAFQIFKSLQLKSGDSFLIHGGAGAIGSSLLQFCKLNGVNVVATGSANKLDYIRSQNAIAVDYNKPNYFETLKEKSKNGFHAAIDFTNQKSFNHSFKLLIKGGKLITCAVFTSGRKIQQRTFFNFLGFVLDFGLMMLKLTIWNALPNGKAASFFGILDSKKDNPRQYQSDFDELQQLVIKQKIDLHIHRCFSLNQAAQAHQTLESGESIGFIVIRN